VFAEATLEGALAEGFSLPSSLLLKNHAAHCKKKTRRFGYLSVKLN